MPEGSKDYFDCVADAWDDMRKNFFPEAVRDRALDVADVRAGKLAAEIGAGTGFMTEALLARGLEVVAVDQSRSMLGKPCASLRWWALSTPITVAAAAPTSPGPSSPRRFHS